MTRDFHTEKEAPKAGNFSRREVLGLIGATAAASLVGGPGEESVSAEQTQNPNRRIVRIDAKPEPIAIDAAKTAVIVVDMQNDFGAKGGMFDLAGIDISGIQKAIGPTAKVLVSARQTGIKIVYLKWLFVRISRTSVLSILRTAYGTCHLRSARAFMPPMGEKAGF